MTRAARPRHRSTALFLFAVVGCLAANGVSSRAAAGRTLRISRPPPHFIRIPGGEVVLGSSPEEALEAAALCNHRAQADVCSPEEFADELGAPLERVKSFWLARTETTVADYDRCVDAGQCAPVPRHSGSERFDRPELPVNFVTLADAERYCEFLGARLPTETEFEWAMRGSERRRFPWGWAASSKVANHGRWGVSRTDAIDGFEELAPASSMPSGASPEGVLHLAGNVAEWTSSPYRPYGRSRDPHQRTRQVIRGGHYLAPLAWLRGAARLHERPTTRTAYLGFRCARSDR